MRAARWLPLSLLFLNFAPLALPQNGEDPGGRISVDVSLVVLHPSVTGRGGLPVPGLEARNFQVFDNGVARPVTLFGNEDIPVTVGLVVDHSGSMRPKIHDVIAAAETFARASNPGDQIFVVNFNEKVSFGLPEEIPFTASPPQLQQAILRNGITGRTALYDAITAALKQLRKGTREKKVLIVISDGGDNASRATLARTMEAAKESDAIIYTVGLFDIDDADRNPRVLEHLARSTGGEAYLPKEPSEVVGICREIARDIRSQYTLGFSPPPDAGTAWHTLRVVATAPGMSHLTVRARTGYYPQASGGSR